MFVDRAVAQANASRQPAINALKNILSIRILAFATPAREHCSVASFGEYALCRTFICIVRVFEGWFSLARDVFADWECSESSGGAAIRQ